LKTSMRASSTGVPSRSVAWPQTTNRAARPAARWCHLTGGAYRSRGAGSPETPHRDGPAFAIGSRRPQETRRNKRGSDTAANVPLRGVSPAAFDVRRGIEIVAGRRFHAATLNWQTFSQVTFAFAVTAPLMVGGLVYALVMGLVGGLLPAVRAARLPVATALRGH
jgi:hypothetical protein